MWYLIDIANPSALLFRCRCLVQFLVDHLRHALQRAPLQLAAVDENRRHRADADSTAFGHVRLHRGRDGGVLPVFFKLGHVQLQLLGNCANLFVVQLIVVIEKLVVKRPEFPLLPCRQGGAGRRFSIFVGPHREVLVCHLHFLGIFFDHLVEQRPESLAVHSLEITENGNHHRGVFRSQERCSNGVDLLDKAQLDDFCGLVVLAAE